MNIPTNATFDIAHLGHVEMLTGFRRFMKTCLGARVTEHIQLDNGRIDGCWFTVNNKTCGLAGTKEHGGNRVELANAGAGLILAPDGKPVCQAEADRMKGQAWGLKTIETFHTHGTPPIEKGL